MKRIIPLLLITGVAFAGDVETNVDLGIVKPLDSIHSYYGNHWLFMPEIDVTYFITDKVGIIGSVGHMSRIGHDDCYRWNHSGEWCNGDTWAKAGLRFRWR